MYAIYCICAAYRITKQKTTSRILQWVYGVSCQYAASSKTAKTYSILLMSSTWNKQNRLNYIAIHQFMRAKKCVSLSRAAMLYSVHTHLSIGITMKRYDEMRHKARIIDKHTATDILANINWFMIVRYMCQLLCYYYAKWMQDAPSIKVYTLCIFTGPTAEYMEKKIYQSMPLTMLTCCLLQIYMTLDGIYIDY